MCKDLTIVQRCIFVLQMHQSPSGQAQSVNAVVWTLRWPISGPAGGSWALCAEGKSNFKVREEHAQPSEMPINAMRVD